MSTTTIARVAAIAWAAIAIAVAFGQADLVPIWIVGIVSKAGGAPEFAVRLVAGAAAAIAGILLAFGPKARIPALLASLLLVFSGIADASARWSLGAGLLPPIVSVVVGGGLLGFLWRLPAPEQRVRRPGVAGVFTVASLVMGAAIAANIDVKPIEPPTSAGRDASGRFIVHDLSPNDWEGRPLEDTGLLDHLPQLRGLSADQPTLVAFYRPNCGACHDLFDAHFGERLPARVVGVRVPPAEGVELVENDLPEEVECADCIRLAFKEGPVWLIQTPVLLEVVDGTVTCVSTDDFHRCVDDAVAAAEAQYAREAAAAAEG